MCLILMSMRLFITTLLIASLLVMPLHAWASHQQCACVEQIASETGEAAASCCCPPASEQIRETDDQPLPRPIPCDQQDCPSSCCSMTLVSAFMLPMGTSLITISSEHQAQAQIEQSPCASPNLLALKRPPKSA